MPQEKMSASKESINTNPFHWSTNSAPARLENPPDLVEENPKCFAEPRNVIQFYRKLACTPEANAYNRKTIKISGNTEVLFLLPEQISVLEDNCQNVIVYGAPGTGKTLLVMLKALEWSKEVRAGKIVVKVSNGMNYAITRFLDINYQWGREMQVVDADDHRYLLNDADDYLVDDGNLADYLKVASRASRSAHGRSFVTDSIIYSLLQPIDLHNFLVKIGAMKTSVNAHVLQRVMRGTVNILNYWHKQGQLVRVGCHWTKCER